MTLFNFPCGTGTTLSIGTDYYSVVTGGNNQDGTESNRQMMCPAAGTIKNLKVTLVTAPGGGTSRTFDIRKGGVTGLTATISNTDTEGDSGVSTLSVAAGDLLSLETTVSGVPAGSVWGFSWDFESTTDDFFPLLGGSNDTSIGDSVFAFFGSVTSSWNANVANRENVISVAGTIKNLYAQLNNAPGSGNSQTFEVWVNNASTGVTVTISDTATSANDTVNTVAISANDKVAIKATDTNSPDSSNGWWGVVFEPTISGTGIAMKRTNSISASAVNYTGIRGSNNNLHTSLTTEQNRVGDSLTLTNFRVESPNALTGSETITLDLMVNGVSGVTLVLDVSNQVKSSSDTVNVVDGDELVWRVTPANTPPTANLKLSLSYTPTVVVSAPNVSQIPAIMG